MAKKRLGNGFKGRVATRRRMRSRDIARPGATRSRAQSTGRGHLALRAPEELRRPGWPDVVPWR